MYRWPLWRDRHPHLWDLYLLVITLGLIVGSFFLYGLFLAHLFRNFDQTPPSTSSTSTSTSKPTG